MRSASPHPPKDRVKLRPGPPKPSRLTSISRTSSSETNDGIKLLERDLQIVTKKLADLKKAPVEDSSSGRNSIGLSNAAPILTNEETIKLQLTEKIMTKLTEVDREALSKTGDTLISRARRSSRDSLLGSDLSCMPAHLTLIDRLMDFHVLIKRNEASTHNSTTSSSKQSSRVNTPNETTQEEVSTYKQLIKDKDDEISKLRAQLEGRDMEVKKYTSQLKAKDDEMKDKHNKNKISLEEEKRKLKSAHKEIESNNEALRKLQSELQSVTAKSSLRSPEDSQYIKELEEMVRQYKDDTTAADIQRNVDILQEHNHFLVTYLEKAVESLGSSEEAPSSAEDIFRNIKAMNHQFHDSKSLVATLFGMIQTVKSQLTESTSLVQNYESKINNITKKHKEEIKQERATCEAIMKGLEDQLLKKKDEMNKLQLEMKDQKIQLAAVIDKNTITHQYEEDSSLVKKLQKLLAEANEQIHLLTEEQKTLTSQVAEFRHAFFDADEKNRDATFLAKVLTEEAARAKEANDDLRKKMADLTQTYLS